MPSVPREFKPLPENASHEQLVHAQHEMASAYATIAAGFVDQIPKLVEDHAEFRVIQEAHGVRLGRLEIWRDELQLAPPLPPMRAEMGSSADLTKHASGEIADKVTAVISDKTTPGPDREQVQAISEDVLRVAIARVKQEQDAQKWREVEEERKKAETDRLAMEAKAAQIKAQADADAKAAKDQADEDKRKLALENAKAKSNTKWALVLAIGMGVIGTVREIVAHLTQAKPVPAYVAPAKP